MKCQTLFSPENKKKNVVLLKLNPACEALITYVKIFTISNICMELEYSVLLKSRLRFICLAHSANFPMHCALLLSLAEIRANVT